jgi:precorrin-2 C(20)-methyltransferase
MSGTLHLVGVGPGDPELLTLKAARLLATVPVIAFVLTETQSHFALDIARACCNLAAELLPVAIPMAVRMPNGDFAPNGEAYAAAAALIADRLAAGRDVAFLCEGDPLFYGSAIYLLALMAGRHPVKVVPGISSVFAAAAAVPIPLVSRSQPLSVLAGPSPDATLRAALARAGSVALIKVGRHFDRIDALLQATGRREQALYIERASLPEQIVARVKDLPAGPKPYFSLILCCSDPEVRL